jgi:hypothetical protein
MKILSAAAFLFVIQMLAVPVWAGTIKEADYPIQYEVMDSSKTGRLMVEGLCSMTLRDKAKTNVDISVSRKTIGSCHVLDRGKVFRGRQNPTKNEIELVVPVGEDKARVEDWRITGTVTRPT